VADPDIRRLKVLTDRLIFGEAPRWHAGRLWFSDIKDRAVKTVDETGHVHTAFRLTQMPSGLGWLPDGRLLVVSMRDHKLMRQDPEGWVEVADVSQYCGGLLNDMVVDDRGRAYIGNIGFDFEIRPMVFKSTNLVRVDPDGIVECVASDVMCPNGMAITPDGRTLLVGQSTRTELLAFDIDAHGRLSDRRVYGRLPAQATFDGLCLDAQSAVWVASPVSNEFLRMLPGGKISDRIDTGRWRAIACMLGGEHRRTLFCFTASKETHETDSMGDSRISTVEVDIPGAGWP
jgi:sugar lactone lactonase YvrE